MITSRFFFRSLCLVAGLLAARAHSAEAPPNIVFILADDLGYGDLGCYGQRRIRTPHLDRLAAEGLRFTQFYAGGAVCAPSRGVLMTGLHTGHALVRANAKVNLRPSDETVPKLLERAGYTCGLVGKWGLGAEKSTGAPRAQGFDYFFGYADQHHAHNYYPTFLVRNEEHVPLRNVVPDEGPYGEGVATVRADYAPDLLLDEGLAFIKRHRARPFFLYFASTLPHANNQVPAGRSGMEIPDYGPYADENWPEAQKGLAAMITRLDRDVGRLLARLDELGLARNTIVIFASDNGPHNENGNDPDFFASHGPLRGIKGDLYEGGIRVPFLVRWPGQVAPGTVSDHAAYFGDFMATVAEIAGVPLPLGRDSLSFLPSLRGDRAGQRAHASLHWEFYQGRRSVQAVRAGDWKALRRPIGEGAVELYDLAADPGETRNLAAARPEIADRLRVFMDAAHTSPEPGTLVSPAPLKKGGPGAAATK